MNMAENTENTNEAPKAKPAAGAKKAAAKLPSKPISFSGQQQSKKGVKGAKTNINSTKKGGVNLMRKLSGM
jgi:hypothetical protein